MALLDEPLPESPEEAEAVLLMRARLRRRIAEAPRRSATEVALLFGISDAEAVALCTAIPTRKEPIAWLVDALANRGSGTVVSLPADAGHVEKCRRWLLEEKSREPAFAKISAFDLPTLLTLAQARDAATIRDRLAYSGAPELPILITGETGSGKEWLARAIHEIWANADPTRKHRKLKVLFVSAMPEHLVNDLLFGHVKGAFTGAASHRDGALKSADGHTLLIDEIGDLSADTQVRLLRVLDHGEFSHLGDDATHRVRVRFLAATAMNLERAVEEGRFRRDLFHRISALHLNLPPLRERGHLAALVEELIDREDHTCKASPLVAARARGALETYTWPGNLRELRHVLDLALDSARGSTIRLDDLPAKVRRSYLELPLEARAHDIISEHTGTVALTRDVVRLRVDAIASAVEALEPPEVENEYTSVLGFLDGIPDADVEHRATISRVKQLLDAQLESSRLERLTRFWTRVGGQAEHPLVAKHVAAELSKSTARYRRAVAAAKRCLDNLHLDKNQWWRFFEYVHSMPMVRAMAPEQVKAALLWSIHLVSSLDPNVKHAVFDAVRRGDGLRGLLQAAMTALPAEPDTLEAQAAPPERVSPRERPRGYWVELAALPTCAAAMKKSGYDRKTVDTYLDEHGIVPAWRRTSARTRRSKKQGRS